MEHKHLNSLYQSLVPAAALVRGGDIFQRPLEFWVFMIGVWFHIISACRLTAAYLSRQIPQYFDVFCASRFSSFLSLEGTSTCQKPKKQKAPSQCLKYHISHYTRFSVLSTQIIFSVREFTNQSTDFNRTIHEIPYIVTHLPSNPE